MIPKAIQKAAPGDDRRFALLFTAVFAFIVTLAVQHHEPWRDEAQTWLIGRDTTLREMFSLLPYQGHPALWYLMVRPLAQLGAPYSSMGALHMALAIGNAFLVLRFAPLPRVIRILFVFSCWMLWAYAVESRVYAVGIFLLFLIAWLYPERHARPWRHAGLVALLFNTNLHMIFLAGGLTLAFAWESARSKHLWGREGAALLLMLLGALALLAQLNWLIPPTDNAHGGRYLVSYSPEEILKGLSGAFFLGMGSWTKLWPAALIVGLLIQYALLAKPIPLALSIFHSTGILLLLWLHTPAVRYYGLLMVGAMFTLWLAAYHDDVPWRGLPAFSRRLQVCLVAVGISLIVLLPPGLQAMGKDWAADYTGAQKMADFILRHNLADLPIAAHRYAHLSSIAPYLPGKHFWYIGAGTYATYYRQDARHARAHALSNDEALSLLSEQFPGDEPMGILLDRPLARLPPDVRLVHQASDVMRGSDEKFYLYLRGPIVRSSGADGRPER